MIGKTVLITGCSSGIGYHCAKRLKEDGFRVFATARRDADVERLKSEGFESCKIDLDDSKSIRDGLDWVLKQSHGELYALFNNGAYGQAGAVEDLTKDTLRAQFETNLFGTHDLTREIIPIMRKQGYGRIIQNSSLLGIVTLRYRGAYNASKFALEGLSDTMRLELDGSGVFVSLIEPGPITSEFRKNALKMFVKNIDLENTHFKELYKKKLKSLESEKKIPYELGSEAVYESLLHALRSDKPKERYRVTKPTIYFAFLKRVLSTKRLDWVLKKVE
jgi:NAD(P)-dependent dehydrogenase (short-subunit alcohol dehydrogenase family)